MAPHSVANFALAPRQSQRHDLLRHVRLVRLTNGILRPTKAAADELETVRRLR
jgi:hypothetical protein